MKDRIKQIRKENKLTQVEFGERIGVKGKSRNGSKIKCKRTS